MEHNMTVEPNEKDLEHEQRFGKPIENKEVSYHHLQSSHPQAFVGPIWRTQLHPQYHRLLFLLSPIKQ